MGITYYKLHNRYGDVYQMKTEHKICLLCSSIIFIIYGILQALDYNVAQIGIAFVTCLHVVFILGTVYPYYLSIQEIKLLQANTKTSSDLSLREIINHPDLVKEFAHYLESEFSSENLLFWNEVANYKKNYFFEKQEADEGEGKKEETNKSYTEIWSEIERIFLTYIKEGAPYQVNLPFAMSQQVEFYINQKTGENLSPQQSSIDGKDKEIEYFLSPSQVLNEAQDEIYRLLASDPLQRFKRTEGYLKFTENLIINSKRGNSKSLGTSTTDEYDSSALQLETPTLSVGSGSFELSPTA